MNSMPDRPADPRPALRTLRRSLRGMPASDGAGVRLTRVIGGGELEQLDPFLLFDVFESDNPDDYIAGFPPHPHRGFETVTYMLAGRMEHRDSTGTRGVIETGGVQWMTAARGIIHSEMPKQADGLMRGVQVWVNLPAELKMGEPGYREFAAADIPEVRSDDGVAVRVIAGASGGVTGPVRGVVTEPLFLDIALPAGTKWRQAVPDGHAAVLYVIQGEIGVSGSDRRDEVSERRLGVLGDGDALELQAVARDSRLLLLAAAPIGEAIARGGPFVMNTPEEVLQAFADYRAGRLAPELTT